VVVIGGSGHVGTYLVPALVERGHEVINVSRGKAEPYRSHPAWAAVEQVTADRAAEDAAGSFGARISGFEADIVVDMISFDLPGTQAATPLRRRAVASATSPATRASPPCRSPLQP
jgi:nucleoside-diphosphate-sugar epimerase